jgi:hypothetical protein
VGPGPRLPSSILAWIKAPGHRSSMATRVPSVNAPVRRAGSGRS